MPFLHCTWQTVEFKLKLGATPFSEASISSISAFRILKIEAPQLMSASTDYDGAVLENEWNGNRVDKKFKNMHLHCILISTLQRKETRGLP